ncbi:ATP-dependent helicase HrpB [Leptospira ognonensis]|uniref:ATP-dependent helicase HrpB n=1 Tax=Leptospira ognonensis TaxID=2484945 RepID=UPI00143866A5|nr:ATP-dependent helicase HrpB [Leptospira ognonensis]
MNPKDFPVLEKQDEILNSLTEKAITLLQAPTGSGKTTCLPLCFLNAEFLNGKKILMLEPRRIAAKNAASRLSLMHETPLGSTIGYRIRFESKISPTTRIEVVTDGILTKLLLSDPELKSYGLIIFDEFHERNLDSDFGLALARRAQSLFRNDLKILIMSATLEGINFEKANIFSPLIKTEGKSYPVEIIYQGESTKRQSKRLSEIIPKALAKHKGDILVFFAGVSEINETMRELNDTLPNASQIIIHKLYGEMSFEDQQNVFRRAANDFRKVILATNLAESSITLSNVNVVIDTGYCKRAIFDPSSGLTKLVRKRISVSSAEQRAGRAGRESPGFCYRLWSKEEESNFVKMHPPEILETDISHLILTAKIWGEEINDLPLVDSPPIGIVYELKKLLQSLGCLDGNENLTHIGKYASALPISLRLAVMCLHLFFDNRLELGVDLATAFSERRLFSEPTPIENFARTWEKWLGISSLNAYPKLKQIKDQLLQNLKQIPREFTSLKTGKEPSLGLLLSLAFPDRIAKSRVVGSNRYKMTNGKGAYFPEGSSIDYPEWILVLETDGNDLEAKINLYAELKESEVLQLHAEIMKKEFSFSIEENEKKDLILKSYAEFKFGEITIKKQPFTDSSSLVEKKKFIYDYFSKNGFFQIFSEPEPIKQLLFRIQLLFENRLLASNISDALLLEKLEIWYFPNFNFEKDSVNLSQFEKTEALFSLFSYQERELIHKETPSHLNVPSGSKIQITYSEGNPFLAVKLQEVFGLSQTPKIAGGKVSVTLHLLSPAGRPVQVTSDLKSFWDTTYHEVKKELKGRYPRHPWPDSPWEAVATKGTKKRS